LSLGRLAVFSLATVLANPFVYFREFEAEKTAYTMSRKPSFFNPSIDRVLGDPKMDCHILNTDPTFLSSHLPLSPIFWC